MKYHVNITKKNGSVVPFEDEIEASTEDEARHKFLLQALMFDAESGYTGPAIGAGELKDLFEKHAASIGVTGFQVRAVSEQAAAQSMPPAVSEEDLAWAREHTAAQNDALVDQVTAKVNSDSGRGPKVKIETGSEDLNRIIDNGAQKANKEAGR